MPPLLLLQDISLQRRVGCEPGGCRFSTSSWRVPARAKDDPAFTRNRPKDRRFPGAPKRRPLSAICNPLAGRRPFPVEVAECCRVGFAADSPLEEAGFELLVPRDTCSDAGRFGRSVLAPDPMSDGRTDDSARNVVATARFVKARWSVSSAAIPARRPQVVAPPDRMPRPYRAVRRTRRDVRQRASAPMGANGLQPTEYGRGAVTEERGAFVPQKP